MANDPEPPAERTEPPRTTTTEALQKLAECAGIPSSYIRALDRNPNWRTDRHTTRTSLFIEDLNGFHTSPDALQLEAWLTQDLELRHEELAPREVVTVYEGLLGKARTAWSDQPHVVGLTMNEEVSSCILPGAGDDTTAAMLCEAMAQRDALLALYRQTLEYGRQASLDSNELVHGVTLLREEIIRLRTNAPTELEDEPEELVVAREVVADLNKEVGILKHHIVDLSLRNRGQTADTAITTPSSAPRPGGKSSRFPDPDPLTDGLSPTVEDWEQALKIKLRANRDHFADDYAKLAYALSRLRDPALGLVKHRIREDEDSDEEMEDDTIETVDELLIVLHEALDDPDLEEKAEDEFLKLTMETTESFNKFRVKFVTLARQSKTPAAKWKKAIHRRLPKQLRLAMTQMSVDKAVNFTDYCKSAAHISYQLGVTHTRPTEIAKGKTPSTSSSAAPTTRRTGYSTYTPAPRTFSKMTPEERRKLMEEGRCFRCKKAGHVSSACPDKDKGSGPITTAKVAVVAPGPEVVEVAGSDSESEN
jgi:hypothetical protein